MAKDNNLYDFLQDVAGAIKEKKGSTEPINAQDFSEEIRNLPSGGSTPSKSKWTGHADADGLRAIGWTDEDIAYYQEHGVNWNEEDDQYHLVTDDNKNLYGVLTADNIQTYKDRIVYLPKIDTSAKTDISFNECYAMIAIPMLNTSNMTIMNNMFKYCYSLTCIPFLDTKNVQFMSGTFYKCHSLVFVPQLDTTKVTNMSNMFYECYSLVSIPLFNTSKVKNMGNMFNFCFSISIIPKLQTTVVTNMDSIFSNCRSLTTIPQLDRLTSSSQFSNCNSLIHINIKNIASSISFGESPLLSKESLLYLINNESATSAITITLAPYAYTRLAEDVDIVAALANHPNVSISK